MKQLLILSSSPWGLHSFACINTINHTNDCEVGQTEHHSWTDAALLLLSVIRIMFMQPTLLCLVARWILKMYDIHSCAPLMRAWSLVLLLNTKSEAKSKSSASSVKRISASGTVSAAELCDTEQWCCCCMFVVESFHLNVHIILLPLQQLLAFSLLLACQATGSTEKDRGLFC